MRQVRGACAVLVAFTVAVSACGASGPGVAIAAAETGSGIAFPGAEGGGARALGGRGGRVYAVTQLGDAGPGSLRDCVVDAAHVGPRTCVFRVSGVIQLRTSLRVTSPFLTVAGQTAPGAIAVALVPGVAAPNSEIFDVRTHDVVLRYLRLWGDHLDGDTPSNGGGTFGVVIHAGRDVIVDHCDLLWFTGKAYAIYAESTVTGTTLSWSIVGENLGAFTYGDDRDGQETPVLLSAIDDDPAHIVDADVHHNLLTSAGWRHPLTQASSSRVVNNFIHWGSWASGVDHGGSADFIGNLYRAGDALDDKGNEREIMIFRAGNGGTLFVDGNSSDWRGPNDSIDHGNRGGVTGNESDVAQWNKLVGATTGFQQPDQGGLTGVDAASYRRAEPLPPPAVPITVGLVDTVEQQLTVAGGVGASRRLDCEATWIPLRDAAQARILAYTVAATGYPRYWDLGRANLTGTLPELPSVAPCDDADGDGLPDAYELSHGLDPRDGSDAARVAPDGYTYLEHYLDGR